MDSLKQSSKVQILRNSSTFSGLNDYEINQLADLSIISPDRDQAIILDETKLRLLSEGPPHV